MASKAQWVAWVKNRLVKGRVTKLCDRRQDILNIISLSFLRCKIGITVLALLGCCED